MNMNFDNDTELINKTLQELCSSGDELYLVGGFIRDSLLKKINYDRDYIIKGESGVDFAQKVLCYY